MTPLCLLHYFFFAVELETATDFYCSKSTQRRRIDRNGLCFGVEVYGREEQRKDHRTRFPRIPDGCADKANTLGKGLLRLGDFNGGGNVFLGWLSSRFRRCDWDGWKSGVEKPGYGSKTNQPKARKVVYDSRLLPFTPLIKGTAS